MASPAIKCDSTALRQYNSATVRQTPLAFRKHRGHAPAQAPGTGEGGGVLFKPRSILGIGTRAKSGAPGKGPAGKASTPRLKALGVPPKRTRSPKLQV